MPSIVVALTLAVLPTQPQAAQDTLTDWRQLQKYCSGVGTSAVARRFCNATWDSLLSLSVLDLSIPTVAQLRALEVQGLEFASPTPALPRINEQAILWGVTEFVVRRFEQDVSALGVRRLHGWLCHRDVREFVTDVCVTLAAAEHRGVKPMIASLRTAARSDMTRLPERALQRFGTELTQADSTRDLGVILWIAGAVTTQLVEGRPLAVALGHALRVDTLMRAAQAAASPGSAAFLRLAVVAEQIARGAPVLDSTGGVDRGVALMVVKTALVNLQAYGTIHQHPLSFVWDTYARSHIRETITTMAETGRRLTELAASLSRLEAQLRGLSSEALAANLKSRRWKTAVATALFDVARVAMARTPDANGRSVRAMLAFEPVVIKLAEEDYATALFGIIRLATDEIRSRLPENISRAAMVAAEMAQAEDAETVAATLDRVASPPGSYLRKRPTRAGHVYFSVNAYLGGARGTERTVDATDNEGDIAAPILPIGIELGVNASSWLSIGLFAHIVDLGALATFRLENDSIAENAPNVGFRQVLSPGIGLSIGLFRLPLAVGVLRSRAPALRQISGEPSPSSVTRTLFFVAYDLPIF